MAVEIKEVSSPKEMKTFIRFPEKLYRDNKYYVPSLEYDVLDTLSPERNPAYDFCDAKLYLAYKDGEVAGRVAVIINHRANEEWNHKEVRFGWYDFIDDYEVSKALMDKVEEFGRAQGMDTVVGPLGFTDFDPEGMLVDGYDRLCTMALIYNHPYYVTHMEKMGFEKDNDWIEFRIELKDGLPEKFSRVAQIVAKRSKCHVRPLTKKMLKEEQYGYKVFHLINECYKDLYNFTILTDKMIKKYMEFYLGLLPLKYVSCIENEQGELVAFGIIMPSLARALQKTRGKLLPFGWFTLAKAMYWKYDDTMEMLLVGVRPDYRDSGINSLLFTDLFQRAVDDGFKYAETNAIMETNSKNIAQWTLFPGECKKRRRSYKKALK
ncbi:MAG: GNAT family N-acetyltransferase [Bacteroidales bacterium]|nr:GNAT family N-acetyltransferase [Bacteroidales bacterium]